ncbi:TonB-dependent receptor [uncultured Brevundimonas sp.]|uniref:TonB-dependent receptor plug domain-containing protein n=1 Tax=uncultured Brevundimonas sp. TaxID=213418 RepID=UPI0026325F78|nr:TonB-dependent receptor [uncultured Brevundimonas sp.]
MNWIHATTAGLAVAVCTPAFADTAAIQSSTLLPDLVVTANRSEQSLDKVGASMTVLSRALLETQQATAIPEALAHTPGVSMTRNGGIGSPASVNIRGAEGHHTVVLIDGVKMNDPSVTQGNANFTNLLVGDIGRIEILRGAQSTLWGSQAIGGVLNIISAEPEAGFQGNLSAEAGSRGTRYLRGAVSGKEGRMNWRLAANRFDTDGLSQYSPGTEDDGFRNTTLSGRLGYEISDNLSLDLRTVRFSGTNDFDSYNGDSREYGNTDELVAYAGINLAALDGRLKNRLGYAYTKTDRQNFNPDRAIERTTFEAEGENRRLEYQGTMTFSETLSATFGAESERSRMQSRSPWDAATKPAFGTGKATQDSIYAQGQWSPLPQLNLTAGIRQDDHSTYGKNTVGQLAAAWTLNDGATTLRANRGQGFRAPGLYELYSDYGNLNLEPEAFDTWEVSVQQRITHRATVIATYFAREADNEIRYYGCSFGTTDPLCVVNGSTRWGYYANIQKTEAQGVELSLLASLTPNLDVTANYTWTDATNASGENTGKRLVNRPEHMANLSVDYRLSNGAAVGISARYSGEVFSNAANTTRTDSYALVDLRGSYPVSQNLEVYGRIENLFDEAYELVPNYGTPGRSLTGGVRVKF